MYLLWGCVELPTSFRATDIGEGGRWNKGDFEELFEDLILDSVRENANARIFSHTSRKNKGIEPLECQKRNYYRFRTIPKLAGDIPLEQQS